MDNRVKGLPYSERIRRYTEAIHAWMADNPEASQREVDDMVEWLCKKYGV